MFDEAAFAKDSLILINISWEISRDSYAAHLSPVHRHRMHSIEDKRLKMPRTSTILGDDDCHNHNSFSREKSLCTLP